MVLPSSPSNVMRRCDCSFPADSCCCRNDAVQFPTQTSRVVVQCQPWFYLRLFAYRFFWLSEGHRVSRKTQCRSTRLTGLWILTLEPERLENQPVIIRDESGMDSRRTLKLLVVLDVRRRNSLLSSKRSKRWPRSYAPGRGG